MRLNSSLLVLITVAIACARASATESQELPRCEKSIRILHSELAPLQMEHPPTGRVELEFTIDPLGHVSDPVVVRSTEPRLDREALRSVVLWRYAPPSRLVTDLVDVETVAVAFRWRVRGFAGLRDNRNVLSRCA